jgi:hypothetical protein
MLPQHLDISQSSQVDTQNSSLWQEESIDFFQTQGEKIGYAWQKGSSPQPHCFALWTAGKRSEHWELKQEFSQTTKSSPAGLPAWKPSRRAMSKLECKFATSISWGFRDWPKSAQKLHSGILPSFIWQQPLRPNISLLRVIATVLPWQSPPESLQLQ